MALSVIATIPKGERDDLVEALLAKTGIETTVTNEGDGRCVVTINHETDTTAGSLELFFEEAGIPHVLDRTVRRTVGR